MQGGTFSCPFLHQQTLPCPKKLTGGRNSWLQHLKNSLAAKILVYCQKGGGHQQDSNKTICWREVKSIVSSPFCEVEQQHLQTHQCWGQTVQLHSQPHHLATLMMVLDALLSNSLHFEWRIYFFLK